MRLPSLVLIIAAVAAWPAAASADEIVSKVSRWNPSRSTIYTDVTVRRASGVLERVTVRGGVVDGIGQVHFHLDVSGALPDHLMRDFVRTRTRNGTRLRWAQSCVYITPDARGTTHLDGDGEHTILEEVLAHWTAATSDCGYLSFMLDEADEPREAGYDGFNVIKFHEQDWCLAVKEDQKPCPTDAAAITVVSFIDDPTNPRDGVILDADIQFNAEYFAFSDGEGSSNGTGTAADLANTLTHEMGHLVGLDHPCWDQAGSPPYPDDSTGAPIPLCEPEQSLPERIRDATMYNFQDPGETKKRTLEVDDIEGFCAVYPRAEDPGMCMRALEKDDGCGCRVGAARRPVAGTLSILGLFVGYVLTLRSARRRRSST